MLKIGNVVKNKRCFLKYDVKFYSSKKKVETKKNKEQKYNLWRWGCPGDSLFSSIKVGEKNKMPEKLSEFENVNIEKISAGCNHSAFIIDGKIFTYGLNDKGQLGRTLDGNEKSQNYSLIPKEVKNK